MASLCCYPNWLRIFITVIIIFCFISTTTVALSVLSNGSEIVKATKMRIGSRPPHCVNRCLSCKPCIAVLVAAPHPKTKGGYKAGYKADVDRGDESYYLLSWKCKCGDRYFQP